MLNISLPWLQRKYDLTLCVTNNKPQHTSAFYFYVFFFFILINSIITAQNLQDLFPPASLNEDSLAFNTQQVKVSAFLFEVNSDEMKERGINWQVIFSKNGMILSSDYRSILPAANNNNANDYNLNIQMAGDIGKFSAYTNAIFRFLEEENLGNIVSSLSVTVRNGQKGRMQVGSDFSVKQRDYAGNAMDAFYPTGTIIEVLPKIYKKDSVVFALLKVNIERSICYPDAISTEIKKTNASTEVIMQNKEEAIISGLSYEQQVKVRNGIPGLKDLPWWVLGIRYLTGYERIEVIHKEVLLHLKIDVIASLKDRLTDTSQLK